MYFNYDLKEVSFYAHMREAFLLSKSFGLEDITLDIVLSCDEIILNLSKEFEIDIVFIDMFSYKGEEVIFNSSKELISYIKEGNFIMSESYHDTDYKIMSDNFQTTDFKQGLKDMLKIKY